MEAMIRGGFKNGAAVDDLMIAMSRTDSAKHMDALAEAIRQSDEYADELADSVAEYAAHVRKHVRQKGPGRVAGGIPNARLVQARIGGARAIKGIRRVAPNNEKLQKTIRQNVVEMLTKAGPEIGEEVADTVEALGRLAEVFPAIGGSTSNGLGLLIKKARKIVVDGAGSVDNQLGQLRGIIAEANAGVAAAAGNLVDDAVEVVNVGGKYAGGDLDVLLRTTSGKLRAVEVKSSLKGIRDFIKEMPNGAIRDNQAFKYRTRILNPEGPLAIESPPRFYIAIPQSEAGDIAAEIAQLQKHMSDPSIVDSVGHWEIAIIPDP